MIIHEFLTACPERETISVPPELQPTVGFDSSYTCKRLSQAVGEPYGVIATFCAECTLEGTPNQTYLDNHVAIAHMGHLRTARLGFQPDPAKIAASFVSLWPLARDNEQRRKFFTNMLVEVVRLGRLTGAHAAEILSKTAPDMIKELGHRIDEAEKIRTTLPADRPKPISAKQEMTQAEAELNKLADGVKLA